MAPFSVTGSRDVEETVRSGAAIDRPVVERRAPVVERRAPVAERRAPVAERRAPVAERRVSVCKTGS